MKDIDFDELDRAVSSVLGQQGPKDEGTGTAQVTETTAVTTETTAEVATNDASAVAGTEMPAQQGTTPATPLAVKRRGKFMDVMHPSHDMTSSAPAAAKPSRSSSVLQPLSSDVTPEAPAEEPTDTTVVEPTAALDESHALIGAEPAPVENLLPDHTGDETVEQAEPTNAPSSATEGEAPAVTEAAATEPAQSEKNDEPVNSLYVDPLELTKSDEQPEQEAAEDTPAETNTEADAPQPTATPAEPSGTPFLTDAQVNKRPLGAFGETEGSAAAEHEQASAMPAPEPTDTQAAPAVPLPRELQPDVVEVESSSQEAEASPAPFASGVKAAEAEDGRVEGHPLFDTSTYHEPIAAVHGKGMPAWAKWLIGLLICLALGAGVGYFLFAAGL